MDLIDKINVVPTRATYDATQVLRDRFSDDDSSENDEEPPQNVGNFMDKVKSIKQRLNRTIESDNDSEDASEEPQYANKSVLLPQLEIDLSDIEIDQIPDNTGSHVTTNQINSTQVIEGQQPKRGEISVEERTRQILEQKRKQREEAKQQLEQDISNVTLQEEEEDEEAEAEAAVEVLRGKDAKEIEMFMNKQKRIDFFDSVAKPAPKVKKFSKMSFIDNFDEDEAEQATKEKKGPESVPEEVDPEQGSEKEQESEKEKDKHDFERISSPLTSPLHSPIKPTKQNPIDMYRQKLQGEEIDLDDLEEVPSLSKDKELSIKQKFVKKLPKTSKKKRNKLLKHLFEMNVHQIHEKVPNYEDIEEDEDEQIMVNLLEQEIERNRNIRKLEKQREKQALAAAAALKGGEGVVEEEEDDGSDYWEHSDQEHSEQDDFEEEGEEGDTEGGGEDQDSEDSENSDPEDSNSDSESENHIMIDNQASTKHSKDNSESESEGVQFSVSREENGFNTSSNFQLFKNLKPISEVVDYIPPSQIKSFIFEEDNKTTQKDDTERTDTTEADPQSQVRLTQVLGDQIQETQKIQGFDQETQVIGVSTQIIGAETQAIQDQIDTQADTQKSTLEVAEMNQSTQLEEEITPELVLKGREQIKPNLHDIEEDEEEEEDPELQERIKAYEEKIRRKELRLLQKRKEMERKGYKKIIEGEAEESEDEWAGIGGADGEFEDFANSEDEKMIDNNLNIDMNDEEIRKAFMEHNQTKDKKQLEKLLDDIKNHKLVKRAGVNIDLSDEEDELLLNYRRQKLQEQKLKLEKFDKSNKSEKAKAFFESIKEDLQNNVIKIDESESEEEKAPEVESETEEPEETDGSKKTKEDKTFNEDFVRSKLSFLSDSFDRYDFEQQRSKFQHNFDSEEEEDLNALKMKSFTNLKRSIREVEIETDDDQDRSDKENEQEDEDEDDEDLLPMRKPSMMKSFRSSSSTVSSFSGVTVSKQYKTASGSKASITFMSKKNVGKRTLK